MNPEQTREAAQRFISQLNRVEEGDPGALDALVELFADNAHLSNPILEREGRERVGREQIAAFWRAYRSTFERIHSDFSELTANEHSAGLFWRSAGTTVQGEPLAYDGVTLLLFDEAGRIVRLKGYFDSDQVKVTALPH